MSVITRPSKAKFQFLLFLSSAEQCTGALTRQIPAGQECANRRHCHFRNVWIVTCSSTCLQTLTHVRSSGVGTEVSTRADLRDFGRNDFCNVFQKRASKLGPWTGRYYSLTWLFEVLWKSCFQSINRQKHVSWVHNILSAKINYFPH